MNAEQTLFALLSGYAGLTAFVGDRIYPVLLPQNATFPAIVYTKISGQRVHSLSGQSGLSNPRIQITCWAQTYSDVKQVSEQVRLALASGAPGVQVDDGSDKYESDTALYRTDIDVRLWQEESV